MEPLTRTPCLIEDLLDHMRPNRSSESRLERLAAAKRQAMTGMTTPVLVSNPQVATQVPYNSPPWLDMSKYPSVGDVVTLKRFFAKTFPTEIVDLIMSFTEHWPHTTSILEKPFQSFGCRFQYHGKQHAEVRAGREARRRRPLRYEDTIESDFLLRSPPLGVCSKKAAASPNYAGFLSRPHVLGIHGTKGVGFSSPFVRLPYSQDWNCPRGQRPARMVILEFFNHFETHPSHPPPSLWYDLRAKNLLDPERISEVAAPPNVWSDIASSATAGELHFQSMTLRFDDDAMVGPLYLSTFGNKYARRSADFVRKLKEGDSIGIWAQGIPGNYVNTFEEVRLHVFWAV